MIDTLHTTLADFARSVKCQCQDKAHWPWKRDEKCRRCVALEAYELRAAEAAGEKTP